MPRQAADALREYLAALDAALPGIARGIYLTGSAALGDWRPGRSDLGILTVTDGRPGDAEVAALEALHAGLPGRPYRDAVYIPADAVGVPPATAPRATTPRATTPSGSPARSTGSSTVPATAPTRCCGRRWTGTA